MLLTKVTANGIGHRIVAGFVWFPKALPINSEEMKKVAHGNMGLVELRFGYRRWVQLLRFVESRELWEDAYWLD